MLLAPRSKPSIVLVVGKHACLPRSRVLLASRAVISVSTRARSSSSGLQRWVLAVISSSGATLRMLASLSRRRPGSRSAVSAAAAAAVVTGLAQVIEAVGRQRPGCGRGQLDDQGVPGLARFGHSGTGSQDGADAAGFPPAEGDRSCQGRDERFAAVRRLQRCQFGKLRSKPGVARGGCAGQPLLGDRAERAERLFGG